MWTSEAMRHLLEAALGAASLESTASMPDAADFHAMVPRIVRPEGGVDCDSSQTRWGITFDCTILGELHPLRKMQVNRLFLTK